MRFQQGLSGIFAGCESEELRFWALGIHQQFMVAEKGHGVPQIPSSTGVSQNFGDRNSDDKPCSLGFKGSKS